MPRKPRVSVSLALAVTVALVPGACQDPPTASAQPKMPVLAVVAEPQMGKNCQYLNLYIENQSDVPATFKDIYSPCFSAQHWFTFKVNNQPLKLVLLGSHILGQTHAKVLPPKSKTYFASAVLRTTLGDGAGGYTPMLNLKPGEQMIEIACQNKFHPVAVKPFTLSVKVLDRPVPKARPVKQPPLVLSLSQAVHERGAIDIVIQLHNLTDELFKLDHGGQEPPWHTAPWFDLEVNGKPYQAKVPPLAFKAEKGEMSIGRLESRYRGELLIPLANWDKKFFANDHYYTPVLPLAVGKYTIRVIPSKRWNQPGITPPAPQSIEVIVPVAKKAKGG